MRDSRANRLVVRALYGGDRVRAFRTGSLTITGATMGTTFTVTVVRDASNSLRSDDARQLIEAELERVDHAMSHYRPDSELSRFNDLRHTERLPCPRRRLKCCVRRRTWEP